MFVKQRKYLNINLRKLYGIIHDFTWERKGEEIPAYWIGMRKIYMVFII